MGELTRPQSRVMGLLIACMSGDVAVDDHSNPSALSVLGYDCSLYAGHSFRIGAATIVVNLKSMSKRLVAPVPQQ